jgi:F0F1-type ATP synthase membrane subunit c/vacuolar-type H+-ATPase subunit K
MNSGPPTQSEIDYGCAVEQVRRERAPRRSLFMTLAVFVALCAAIWIVSFAFGYAWGFTQ